MQRRPCRDEAREGHVASRAAHGLEVDVGQRTRSGGPRLLLPFAPVGDLARRHERCGQGDGEQDQGPRIALDGVG